MLFTFTLFLLMFRAVSMPVHADGQTRTKAAVPQGDDFTLPPRICRVTSNGSVICTKGNNPVEF